MCSTPSTPILDEDADTQNCTDHTLDVAVVGAGSVSVSPDQPTYAVGDVVTLTATADAGAQFVDWTGDVIEHRQPVGVDDRRCDPGDGDVRNGAGPEPSGFVSDDFNACAVDPVWSFVDPVGDGSRC